MVFRESGGPLASDWSRSVRFAGAGRLFLYPLSNIHQLIVVPIPVPVGTAWCPYQNITFSHYPKSSSSVH